MQIDLLYFEGCPSYEQALKNIKAALAAERLKADIRLVKVENDDEAARLKFLGSPSFRLDGLDLWQEQRKRYNLSCRVYTTPQGLTGVPTVEMLRERLHNHTPKTLITT
jgi:hypothetical protein